MKHKFDLKNLNLLQWMILIPGSLTGLLFLLFAFLSMCSPYSQKAESIIKSMSELLELTLCNYIIIAIVFVLIDLILAFFLLKFFKKTKQNIPQNNAVKESGYTPSEDEVEVLKLFRNGKILLKEKLILDSPFSTDITNRHFTKLLDNKFIKIYKETESDYILDNQLGSFRYILSTKGRDYLYDNNLLD